MPRTSPACPQLRASEIARKYGFTPRQWIRLAAAGKIPGARQPAGARGQWLFDAVLFANWSDDRTKKVEPRPGYTAEVKVGCGGAAPSVRAESTEEASRRRIEQLRNAVFGSGSTTSMRSPGAISRGVRSKRRPRDSFREHLPMLKPRAAERYITSLKHLAAHFDGRTLDQIKSAELSAFETKRRSEGVRPGTIRRDLACLS